VGFGGFVEFGSFWAGVPPKKEILKNSKIIKILSKFYFFSFAPTLIFFSFKFGPPKLSMLAPPLLGLWVFIFGRVVWVFLWVLGVLLGWDAFEAGFGVLWGLLL
jgi:hypothetical protein